MKSFRIIIFLSFVYTHSIGQTVALTKRNYLPPSGSLSGVVIEKTTGLPLAGASVYIPDLKLGVIADSLGHYRFNSLPSGRYLLEVHALGYKTFTESVVVNGDITANFSLTDQFTEESPVVVTGLSKATQIKRSPVPIVSINHEYLTTNLSTNIIDAISRVPGVTALTTGPNVSKPFIRGLGFNRILTLYDGMRQEGQQWGDEHGIEADQYSIDRVEVIKGPASLTYGSDAIAGVVNLVPTPAPPEGKMIGDVLAEYQTNNGMYGGSAMLAATNHGFEWLGRVSHKSATNYQNSVDGRVYNTGFRETDATASVGLHKSWGYSHLILSLYDDLQEIPDGSRDSASRRFTKQITEEDSIRPIVSDEELKSYKITPLHQHVQHYRAYLMNNFALGQGKLAVNLGLQRSVRREFSHPQMPDIPGLYLQLNTYSYDVKYYFPEWNGWNLLAGVNGMYEKNDVESGTDFVIPSYHQFDAGVFAMVKKSFDKLDIAGGIRFDSRSFNNQELYTKTDPVTGFDRPLRGNDIIGADHPFSAYNKSFSGVSGSVGATYNFTEKLSVKANLSRGYRAPNILEISANGIHPGTNIYQVGNSSFKPEFSFQQDIGFAFTSRYAVIGVSVFNNSLSDFIFNQRIADSYNGDSSIQVYQFRQGKAGLYGGEISVDIHPVKALHFENSLSVVYGINKDLPDKTDSNRYLPFIPPLHGVSELRYDFGIKQAHIVHGYAKVQLAYYAKQDRVYLVGNTETATPGYALFNAGIGGDITNRKGKKILSVSVQGNNLLDKAYQDHLSRLKYFEPYPADPRPYHGIYNMGRNISFRLDFPLEFKLHTNTDG